MTINELLKKGMIALKSANIDTPQIKARLLLQYVLGMKREPLIIYDKQIVPKNKEIAYMNNIEKIRQGVPLQYITHSQEFMKMNFYINNDVLIPRPDTEVLVEEVIRIAKKINNPVILDLCTGSGAIGISIAKYVKDAKVYASDISEKALEIAKKNAKINDVNIEFIKSDLFKALPKMKFDIIVSNPPYIRKDIIRRLNIDVQKEPIIALDGGKDGLDFYRRIVEEAPNLLKWNSYLCFEIGYDQKKDVTEIIEKSNMYYNTYHKKDLCDNDRVIITQKSN